MPNEIREREKGSEDDKLEKDNSEKKEKELSEREKRNSMKEKLKWKRNSMK